MLSSLHPFHTVSRREHMFYSYKDTSAEDIVAQSPLKLLRRLFLIIPNYRMGF